MLYPDTLGLGGGMRAAIARACAILLLLGVAGCSGGGGGSSSGGSGPGGTPPGPGPGPTSCYLFQVGSTCALTLTPFDVQDFFFEVPGQGQTFITISLTGSTTFATWDLVGPFGGTCNNFTFGIDQSCVAVVNGGASYFLSVYEGEGRAGSTNLTIGKSQNLGSIAKPLPVSTDSLVNGSVGANGSSYFSFTAAESASHTIALTGLFSQLSWELFNDPGYLNRIRQCTFTDQAADLACLASLSAGSAYYLKVQEFSGAPQEFQLTIGSGALNEGSPASPVAMAVGGPSRPSTVDVLGHSHFTFTPRRFRAACNSARWAFNRSEWDQLFLSIRLRLDALQ